MIDFLRSSIGKKVIMGLSGLFLIVFLTLHAGLNLTALSSHEWYDAVCEFMDTNLLVKSMVPVLALGFVFHIFFSMWIEFKNWTARPRNMRYHTANRTKVSWAAKNMFVLGIIVLGCLLLHLSHFWAQMQLQGFLGKEEANAYELLVVLFKNPIYCILYIVWMCAIAFHVYHGFWSAFQSIGVNNSKWLPRLQAIAQVYAILIFIAYVAIPFCIYFFF